MTKISNVIIVVAQVTRSKIAGLPSVNKIEANTKSIFSSSNSSGYDSGGDSRRARRDDDLNG